MNELNQEIETVKTLLKDESVVLSVDPLCLESGKEFERDTGLPKHPLQGLCLVSCILFKQVSKSGREYDLYEIPRMFYKVTRRDKRKRSKTVKECAVHYFLKHRNTNQIIDLTREQFEGAGIPYSNCVKRTNLQLQNAFMVVDRNNDFVKIERN